MTIKEMLRHHGYNCSRVVLPSGRLEFQTSKATTACVGLPLTTHTFHGGDEPVETADNAPWWLAKGALDRDRAEMKDYFPSFVEIGGDAELAPAWVGLIETRIGHFRIAVIHRFDHSLPKVVPIEPKNRVKRIGRRLIDAPHLYTNGNLCVAAQEDWDCDRDSIATVVAWAAHWHAFYVEWLFTGNWPSEGYIAEAA
ncbi:hypothetical protein A5739_05960 [Mycobacterium colombiense]|uniref:hypothetical protein n=1 Tax=Mycobacterium colombiense TaxID=339268 RepID=UPI00096D0693|nr:hypothetical protein [Mycobacterium colombiense]OMC34463.1 hypothetical protein A5739_05960 [Mycobacterium colombiense]